MKQSYYGSGQTISRKEARYIKKRDRYKCRNCHETFAENHLEVDHIRCKAEGGSDDRDNLCALCVPCHETKTLEEIARGKARQSRNRPPTTHPSEAT